MEHDEQNPLEESTQEQIPLTPQPENSNTDSAAERLATLERQNNLLLDSLRSTNARLNAQAQELEEARKPAPRVRNVEEETQEYFKDPIGSNARLIEEALERRMKPFQQYIERLQNDSLVDQLINNIKQNPNVAAKWNQPLENWIRANVTSLNPLNENSFAGLVAAAFGQQTLGLIESPAPSTPAPKNMREDNRIMPPNVPSNRSAPTNPNSSSAKRRELTEEEKRLARENRMTDDQYLDWLEVDRRGVVNSTIGKAAK